VPTWTVEQENALVDMVKENKPIEEIAETLRRSVDAVVMKAKRMGLPVSSALQVSSSSRPSSSKVSSSE